MLNLFNRNEPKHPVGGAFIRDIVFGANDGVVTSIGFLVGLTGALPQPHIVVIGGILTIVAGSASMALGNYLATKSEKEFYTAQSDVESWEIDHKRDEEIAEVRGIFKEQGFNDEDVAKLTDHVTNNRELWIKTMLRNEIGATPQADQRPWLSGIIIGTFYLAGGLPPLVPYLLVGSVFTNVHYALFASIIVALLVMVVIGTIRVVLNRSRWTTTVGETIFIGVIATLVGFLAGQLISALGIQAVG